jgi:hypothetical protein
MTDQELVYFMGGPADGEVMSVDLDLAGVLVYDRVADENAQIDELVGLGAPGYRAIPTVHYTLCRAATPDRWVQWICVPSNTSEQWLSNAPESRLIHAIMTVWRERHRRNAQVAASVAPVDHSTEGDT